MRSIVPLASLLLGLLGGTAFADEPPAAAAHEAIAAAATAGNDDDTGDEDDAGPSKKQAYLGEKAARRRVHAREPASACGRFCLTVRNTWTREVLPVDPERPPPAVTVDELLRDHFTNQATRMDPRLAEVLVKAARKFKSDLIEIVSGYRAPKYNLMLRKKGHAVARDSQHPLGNAVDFRLIGVRTKKLYQFIRSLRVGGVGYYPHNGFVHADVGRVRTWKGE